MGLGRLTISKPIYVYTPITRPLTCVTSTAHRSLQTQQDLQQLPLKQLACSNPNLLQQGCFWFVWLMG
ncbi:hypothetical protein SLE2022_092350 [Rubroshorea leprosula]